MLNACVFRLCVLILLESNSGHEKFFECVLTYNNNDNHIVVIITYIYKTHFLTSAHSALQLCTKCTIHK